MRPLRGVRPRASAALGTRGCGDRTVAGVDRLVASDIAILPWAEVVRIRIWPARESAGVEHARRPRRGTFAGYFSTRPRPPLRHTVARPDTVMLYCFGVLRFAAVVWGARNSSAYAETGAPRAMASGVDGMVTSPHAPVNRLRHDDTGRYAPGDRVAKGKQRARHGRGTAQGVRLDGLSV